MDKTLLEDCIDNEGMATILEKMAQICDEKAFHIAESYEHRYNRNSNSSAAWRHRAKQLRTLADKIGA